jgi:hypothetical protein
MYLVQAFFGDPKIALGFAAALRRWISKVG